MARRNDIHEGDRRAPTGDVYVVTRTEGQGVVIDKSIEVGILTVTDGKVRIAIRVPQMTSMSRTEFRKRDRSPG